MHTKRRHFPFFYNFANWICQGVNHTKQLRDGVVYDAFLKFTQ